MAFFLFILETVVFILLFSGIIGHLTTHIYSGFFMILVGIYIFLVLAID